LWEVSAQDAASNVVTGDVLALETRGCLVRSDTRLVTTLGLEDLIIVDTADSLLIVNRERSGDIREIVAELESRGREEHKKSCSDVRPWGQFEVLSEVDNHKVKRLTVTPGGQLSRQYHNHREEHWVIVSGNATVELDGVVTTMGPGESCDVPVGCVHRLGNETDAPLVLIEVQTGRYLGEDDIVRLVDNYGRAEVA